jgi:hypothetical protein
MVLQRIKRVLADNQRIIMYKTNVGALIGMCIFGRKHPTKNQRVFSEH